MILHERTNCQPFIALRFAGSTSSLRETTLRQLWGLLGASHANPKGHRPGGEARDRRPPGTPLAAPVRPKVSDVKILASKPAGSSRPMRPDDDERERALIWTVLPGLRLYEMEEPLLHVNSVPGQPDPGPGDIRPIDRASRSGMLVVGAAQCTLRGKAS